MLTEEGLVDILTLRDNKPSQSNNYVTALKLYGNAKVQLLSDHFQVGCTGLLNGLAVCVTSREKFGDAEYYLETNLYQ
jgi:hypothetical protein